MTSVGTSVKIAAMEAVEDDAFFFFLTLLGPALGPDLLDTDFRELEKKFIHQPFDNLGIFFEAAPRPSQAGLQSTVTTLPYANFKPEVRDSLLYKPTHTWAIANKEK